MWLGKEIILKMRRRRKRIATRNIIGVIGIAVFLYLSYDYFMKNSVDAYFTRLIQLPLIYQTVPSWIYWLIVLGICFGIYYIINR